jgi:polygalacturonase
VAGAPLDTTIAAVAGLHTVILEDTARSSVSHASVTWGPDDTSALRALLDLAGSSGGGTVYFPTGLYRVSGQPALNINYSSPLWAMLVIKGNYLHDLNPIIDGNPDNTTAIRVTNATNVTIDSNGIARINYRAIGIIGITRSLYEIANVTIRNNAIKESDGGIYVVFD